MEKRRTFLYMLLGLIGLFLWNAWQIDYPTAPAVTQTSPSPNTNKANGLLLPSSVKKDAATEVLNTKEPTASAASIRVKTDVLDLQISLNQGDILAADLLHYPLSTEDKNTPFPLLNDTPGKRYVANSPLVVQSDNQLIPLPITYHSEKSLYDFTKDASGNWVVKLQATNAKGLNLQKTFTFKKGSYLIDVAYQIENISQESWKGYMNTQLLRSSPSEDKSSVLHIGSYTGASYSNPDKHRYQKVSFTDMTKSNLNVEAKGGWIAMQQHYFLSAWVPSSSSESTFYSLHNNDDYVIGAISQPILVSAGQKNTVSSRLYIGPENTQVLKTIAPHLDLTVDYGVLWFISSLLFSLMRAIYQVVGNWGWSIVIVTILIKLAFYRLSATSYKSMAGMRKLQPKLQALKDRYGDDKAKISQATMELYRQEKVNPLGGCLPILIQIPVFIALYWVLLESVELRQAPFIFWIQDLASADPYHVLPIIMGITMLIQQKLNPAPQDPMQARIMMFLPILFTGLFWAFPAGLVLYWIVNNTLSIIQQWYITRTYEEKPGKKPLIPAK